MRIKEQETCLTLQEHDDDDDDDDDILYLSRGVHKVSKFNIGDSLSYSIRTMDNVTEPVTMAPKLLHKNLD